MKMKTGWTIVAAFAAVMILEGIAMAGHRTGHPAWRATATAAVARRPNARTASDTSIATGRRLYQRECQPCHGASGRGDGPKARELEVPPGNLQSEAVKRDSDGVIFWMITEGRRPMPSFRRSLNEPARWDIVNYVRTLQRGGGGR